MKRISSPERTRRLRLLGAAIAAATGHAQQLHDDFAGLDQLPTNKLKEAALRIAAISNENLTEYFLHYPTRVPKDNKWKYASGATNATSDAEEETDIAQKVRLLNETIYECDQAVLAGRIATLAGGRFPDIFATDAYDDWSFALGNFSLLVNAAKAQEHIRRLNREAAGSLTFHGRSVSEEYHSFVAFLLDEEASESAHRRLPDSTFD